MIKLFRKYLLRSSGEEEREDYLLRELREKIAERRIDLARVSSYRCSGIWRD